MPAMNNDDAARSAGLDRMNPFALEPGGEVFFQNEDRLPWLVGRQVTPLDCAVDGMVTAFGQLGGLINRDGVVSDHFGMPPQPPRASPR